MRPPPTGTSLALAIGSPLDPAAEAEARHSGEGLSSA
jgi:hypothetical protein